MGKGYSDSANYWFVVKGAKRIEFVGKCTEATKGADAFQACDTKV